MTDSPTGVRDLRGAQAARNDWAIASSWVDAASVWEHLRCNTNIVRATQVLDWNALCPPNATVLDLGCGSGWLTAMLSSEPNVQRVVAWDSSSSLLTNVLPETVRLVGGEPEKIEAVCGDFAPLLLEDGTIDVVVMSSAFHHADRPERLLADLARVISPRGRVALLNETPWHPLAFLGFATRTYAAALAGLLRPVRRTGHLGSDYVLYDDDLGDRAYTLRTWRRLLNDAGWSMQIIDTGMPSYPERFRPRGRFEPNLFHFILRPTKSHIGAK